MGFCVYAGYLEKSVQVQEKYHRCLPNTSAKSQSLNVESPASLAGVSSTAAA